MSAFRRWTSARGGCGVANRLAEPLERRVLFAAGIAVQHLGAVLPSTEGFVTVSNGSSGTTTLERDRGFDAIETFAGQNATDYYDWQAPVTPAIASEALSNGFTLAVRARAFNDPEFNGAAAAAFDPGTGVRYLIDLGQTANNDTRVQLDTSIGYGSGNDLVSAGPSTVVSGDGYHLYELRYDTVAHTTNLFIDGVQAITGYAGTSDFAAGSSSLAFGAQDGVAANFNEVSLIIAGAPSPTPTPTPSLVGTLDSSFGGGDGLSVIDPPGPAVKTTDVVDLPGGKSLALARTVAALGGSDLELLRFNADGSLDTTFGGGDGVATLDIRGTDDLGSAVVSQSDGTILVGGSVDALNGGGTAVVDSDFFVARFTADGTLDTTFGTAGAGFAVLDFAANANIAPSIDTANDLAVQADGKIILAGDSSAAGGGSGIDLALARFNADGSIDGAFGTGGKVVRDAGANADDVLNAIAVQADGKLVAAGSTGTDDAGTFLIARFNADGTIDQSFGAGGISITDFEAGFDQARGIVIQSDGKLIAGGVTASGAPDSAGFTTDFAITRLNVDGTPDTSFAGTGKATVDFGGLDGISKLTLQPGGKLIASGRSVGALTDIAADSINVAVARLNADGTLDTAFSDDGKVLLDTGAPDNQAPLRPAPVSAAASAGIAGGIVTAAADATLTAQFDAFLADAQGLVAVTQGGGILLLATRAETVRLALLIGDAGAPTVALAVVDNVTETDVSNIEFAVQYSDDLGVDVTRLGTGDLRVTGPGGFSQLATFVDFQGDSTVGTPRVARYRVVPASGNTFTPADNGSYTISVEANRIADVSGNVVAAAAIPDGTFTITVPDNLPNLVAGAVILKLKSNSVIGGSKGASGTVTVTDASDLPATGTVTISLFASTDGTVDAGDTPVATIPNQKVSLKANKGKAFKLKFATFPSPPDGDYFLLAQVDSGDAIPELKKSDNVGSTAQKITIAAPFIDLSVPGNTLGPIKASFAPLETVSFAVPILDGGNTAVKATTDARLFASIDGTVDGTGTVALGTLPLKLSLTPGKAKTTRLKFKLPAQLPPSGTYLILLQLDGGNAIAESNETNNTVASSNAFTVP